MDDRLRNDVREKLRGTSKFFRRLEAVNSDETVRLASAVVRVVCDAENIGKHVLRSFPRYTLHDGKHLWNVLHRMEQLAGSALASGSEVGAFDCALCQFYCYSVKDGTASPALWPIPSPGSQAPTRLR